MNKLLLIVVSFFSITNLCAQNNYDLALGIRGGDPSGLTGKYFLTEHSVVEGIIGVYPEKDKTIGVGITPLYEYHGYLMRNGAWFLGLGGSLIVRDNVTVHPDAIVGVEYTFDRFPLNISIDWKPIYKFREKSFVYDIFGLSLRYHLFL